MAAYAQQWKKLLAPWRKTSDARREDTLNAVRNPFLVDYDRLIFASSFRRLARKTQVHPLVRNDHIHNRLTHSLEVGCVGRSLVMTVGAALQERGDLPAPYGPEHLGQIVQAACLAHDIGNPPFGHAGEEAIRDWFCDQAGKNGCFGPLREEERADFMAFDGNAQGFRVVNALENNKDRGGLRLTFPVVASLVKYPRSAREALDRHSRKFNFYTAERELFAEIFQTLGLGDGPWQRHPLSYLLEAADDICYRIIDMEDARELRIIGYADLFAVMKPLLVPGGADRLERMDSDRRRSGMLRTLAMGTIIPSVARTFMERYEDIMHGALEGDLLRHAQPQVRDFMDAAKEIFNGKIMNDPQKTALEIGTYTLYRRLLDVFIPACCNSCGNVPMSYRETRALTLMGANAPGVDDNLYTACLRVVDFVSGMTDDYATFVSRQFSGTAGGRDH
ncbi:deoxyguanosinetriphosphate triphosphohydrolase [Desulfovibrio legallii]|uniref:Deoxyguanosinetriphosphate triphosphohydrolase n=1 Tax=Desulfovibrio legallii TaxID=571438 RepID=A0A6H3FCY0_9BACT|nr:deoxyguanosinetriphosphate triphosphohydrolase [Desulfovibrio legallii]RHH21628.1 deoxyguanosinetriphosphate triphosphohydrolase [Desulfovibrio sp. AM18-2]TBH81034.1 deoxyguanosinetriphosphate triphosphohydrolase [Desulfovibrio legallii]